MSPPVWSYFEIWCMCVYCIYFALSCHQPSDLSKSRSDDPEWWTIVCLMGAATQDPAAWIWAWAQFAIYTLQFKASNRPIPKLFSLNSIIMQVFIYNDVLNNILAYGSFLFVESPIKLLIDFSSSKRISILIII